MDETKISILCKNKEYFTPNDDNECVSYECKFRLNCLLHEGYHIFKAIRESGETIGRKYKSKKS